METTMYTKAEILSMRSSTIDKGKITVARKLIESQVGCWTTTELVLREQLRHFSDEAEGRQA